jgi:transcriptional regulator GlxA family with amidase domain
VADADRRPDAGAVARLAPVLAAVAAHPAGDYTAPTMADMVGVSPRQVGRLFVRHLGLTPGRYVEQVRVAAAKALLTGTDAPLAEVAARAGFGSAETLRRTFMRTVGVTPGAYRRCPDPRVGRHCAAGGTGERWDQRTNEADRPA